MGHHCQWWLFNSTSFLFSAFEDDYGKNLCNLTQLMPVILVIFELAKKSLTSANLSNCRDDALLAAEIGSMQSLVKKVCQ